MALLLNPVCILFVLMLNDAPFLAGHSTEEGGRVARLANNENFDLPKYESSSAVGAGRDVSAAREMGRTIGTYLNEYGFNLDFAPVADLNTNPDNPVIGTRAFGSDPETVAELVGGACEGFAQAGVACTLKHFPGHGDTSEDTHNGAVSTGKTLDELKACELVERCTIFGGSFNPSGTGNTRKSKTS